MDFSPADFEEEVALDLADAVTRRTSPIPPAHHELLQPAKRYQHINISVERALLFVVTCRTLLVLP